MRQWIVEALLARNDDQRQQQQQQQRAAHSPESSTKASGQKDNQAAYESAAAAATAAAAPTLLKKATAVTEYDADAGRKKARVESPASRWGGAVASSSLPSVAALLHVVDALVEQATTPNEAQAMLLQLRRLIEARKEVQRSKSVDDLNDVMEHIQTRVDDTRRTARENRTAWHQSMLEDVAKVEGLVVSAQDKTAEGVEQLNEDLKKVKASNQAINERIACMEIELQQTLEELRAEEFRWTSEIDAKCTREAERLEFEVDQSLINRSRPLALISDYMQQPMS